MKTKHSNLRRGIVSALVIGIAALALAWLAIKTAVAQVLSPGSPVAISVDPDNPDIILNAILQELAQTNVELDQTAVSSILAIARSYPLDARPYVILGRLQMLNGDPDTSTAVLEAGQTRNPRDRLANLFLLERYLREEDYELAVQQLGVLSRLVSGANSPITQALVLMTDDPTTFPAVRQTLANDPALERQVLVALAESGTAPARIFDLASRRAIARAGAVDGFGPPLISRLIADGQYQTAFTTWQEIFEVDPEEADSLVRNPSFRDVDSKPPFDWTFATGGVGTADPSSQGLQVQYYGRESGVLTSQTLVLSPGRYQLSFEISGEPAPTESELTWQVACIGSGSETQINLPIVSAQSRSRAPFLIPSDCAAQTLSLVGRMGEFPESIDVTVSEVAIEPFTETAR